MSTDFGLNDRQKEAVIYDGGPLLLIAGAGTGKTTVVTERIRHFLVDKNLSANSVLALTFTEKAAFEMQERVDALLPYGYTSLWIHTFHSFCDRILRDNAHEIGIDIGYRLLTQSESILFLKKHIFDLGLSYFRPLGNPTKFLGALLTHFSRLADEDISPNQYIDWVRTLSRHSELDSESKKDRSRIKSRMTVPSDEDTEERDKYLELANAYKTYEELKIKEGVMDFSDLITSTLKLFRERPALLKKYQSQFQLILVDEFQDTNYAQNILSILLTGDKKNITVVADDDQSIYRFRGAAVSNVLQFKTTFPDAEIITLIDNYRSTQTILDAAYTLIQNNNPNRLEIVENVDKKLTSHSKGKEYPITVIHQVRSEDEAEEIALKIKKLTQKQYAYKDIAILVRANNHAQAIVNTFTRHNIPYQFLGPSSLFQQDEIKDLIAYLTFLTNLSDSVSLFRVLSMDIFSLPILELHLLLTTAKKKNLSLFETLALTDLSFLTPSTKEKLQTFLAMIESHLQKSKKDTAGQILYYFLTDTGLFRRLSKSISARDIERAENIAKFFDKIKSFESEKNDASVFTLIEWISLILEMGDGIATVDVEEKEKNAVNILTVHASKGLEFKVVFLVNLVNERFPTRERAEKIPLPDGILKEKLIDDDFHIEEERRLFYVGMTRAKEQLFFSAADFYGGGKRAKKLSPFLYESLPDFIEKERIENTHKQLSLSDIATEYSPMHVTAPSPIKFSEVSYITFSNLQMFAICPLHYKAKVILHIPTTPTSAQSFGISLHETLRLFYAELQEGATPSLSRLNAILKKEWLSEGYTNKTHEKARFEQAKKILQTFFTTECNPPIIPLALELPFSFTLKNGVKVFGKMDRIDKKENGIEIIDYKTGQQEASSKGRSSSGRKNHELQLALYALAATRVKDPIFNRKPEDISLTLHFLDGNTKKTMQFTKEDLEKFEDEVIATIGEIEKSDFECSKSILCNNCEYRMLCKTN